MNKGIRSGVIAEQANKKVLPATYYQQLSALKSSLKVLTGLL